MDETTDKRRFMIFAALRLSGLVLFFLGVAIAFSDLLAEGGLPLPGVLIALLGLTEAVLAPKLLKRLTDI